MGWTQQTSKVVGSEPQVRVKIDASDWRLQSLFRNSCMDAPVPSTHCTQARCIHPVMCWEGQASYFGSRAETTASNGVLGERGSMGALQAPPAGSGAESRLLKGFLVFQKRQTASPGTY